MRFLEVKLKRGRAGKEISGVKRTGYRSDEGVEGERNGEKEKQKRIGEIPKKREADGEDVGSMEI